MKNPQKNNPIVSIIIPCLNEEGFIDKCLDSILDQTYPNKKLEILIVDGISEDKTRKIVKQYTNRHNFIKLLDNPKRITPAAFNKGIKKAQGQFIVIMGAHNTYKKDYIEKCVHYLTQTDADNVGGIRCTKPKNKTLIAKTISYILQSPFGAGNAHYKNTKSKKPKEVDTVFGGCYKKEIFEKIGYFNEKLKRHQDFELNSRLRKNGGKILLIPEIKCYYYAPGTIKKLIKKNFQNGQWDIYTQKIAYKSKAIALRHFIPLFFVLSIIITGIWSLFSSIGLLIFSTIIFLYILVDLFFSIKIGLKRGLKFILPSFFLFFLLHCSFGIGSLWGLLTLYKIK